MGATYCRYAVAVALVVLYYVLCYVIHGSHTVTCVQKCVIRYRRRARRLRELEETMEKEEGRKGASEGSGNSVSDSGCESLDSSDSACSVNGSSA